MLAVFLRSAAAFASGVILIAASLSAVTAADSTKNPIDIREWDVPYEGRPRDPFAAVDDEIWFVGQVNGYLGRLTPSTGEFFKRDLGEGAGPHNLIVDERGACPMGPRSTAKAASGLPRPAFSQICLSGSMPNARRSCR